MAKKKPIITAPPQKKYQDGRTPSKPLKPKFSKPKTDD